MRGFLAWLGRPFRRSAVERAPRPEKCLDSGCGRFRSPLCWDGACRWHCRIYCGCEEKLKSRAQAEAERAKIDAAVPAGGKPWN
jgi:hypothetical protein